MLANRSSFFVFMSYNDGEKESLDEKKRLEDGSRKLGGKFKKNAPKILVGKNRNRI